LTIARAVELARSGRDRARPKPTVGAVVVAGGEVVGEGVTEASGRHAEVVALAAAGERARNATLYVSLEPCNHHGTTPPCTEAILEAGIERVVYGAADPNPEAAGGAERLRFEGVDVEFVDSFEARAVNEAWRTWLAKRRPFVIYKAATTLDGRVTMPGERWVTGEESRRAVHELRASVDAVAVGGGTARADRPRLDARDVDTPRGQPRRLVFSRGPLPAGVDLELRSGALDDELHALADEGVQSLLLEGGPTLAASFLESDLVDKVLLFVAPTLAGAGPRAFAAAVRSSRTLARLRTRQVGADVLLEAYVHLP
jgi:diaminohydroxyphosphoribosylaminopyrimidine deaminase / 5-amino-6-(5-phosphoribosylamino)uracil reductase